MVDFTSEKLVELLNNVSKSIVNGEMAESVQRELWDSLISKPDPETVKCLFLGWYIRSIIPTENLVKHQWMLRW